MGIVTARRVLFAAMFSLSILSSCASRSVPAANLPADSATFDQRLLLSSDDVPPGYERDVTERAPKLDLCGVGPTVGTAPSVIPTSLGYSRSASGPNVVQFVFVFSASADADAYVSARQLAVKQCVLPAASRDTVEVKALTKDFGESTKLAVQLRRISSTESGDVLQDEVMVQRGRIVEVLINQSARIIDSNRTFYTVEAALRRIRAVPIS